MHPLLKKILDPPLLSHDISLDIPVVNEPKMFTLSLSMGIVLPFTEECVQMDQCH